MSSPPTGLRRVVAASMAGTVVEWYEFFLYGTAATLVFSKVFFAQGGNDLDAIFAAFVTYAVGFAARPIGGIVFGQLGDRYGRKKLLQFSLLLVGVATFLMGCLPTFAQIGYWAPALLVTLRFIQGFAVGGEWGGAVLLVAEHSPNASRGFWASWPQAGVPGGNMLATAVLLVLTSTLSDAAFLSWGWRVAFWLSAIVVLIGYYIRTKVTDAPIFLEAQRQAEHTKASRSASVEVLKRYPRGVFTAMGLRLGENIMYYLVVTFSITYLKVHVHANTKSILWWLLVAHAVHFAVIPLAGRLSDRFGRRPVYFVGAVRAGTWGFFAFPMMNSGQQRDHHVGGRHRFGVPRSDVRGPAGHHGGDVPDPDAVFRSVAGLSGHVDRGRVRWRRSSPSACSTSTNPRCPSRWYLAAAAAVSAVAAVAARETKGIDLADHRPAPTPSAAAQPEPVTGLPEDPNRRSSGLALTAVEQARCSINRYDGGNCVPVGGRGGMPEVCCSAATRPLGPVGSAREPTGPLSSAGR